MMETYWYNLVHMQARYDICMHRVWQALGVHYH